MKAKYHITASTLLFALAMPLLVNNALAKAPENKHPVELMFVQASEKMVSDDKTLRLVNAGKQTLYFSDRPNRVAGNLTMQAYMDEWKAGAGPDDFASDPPNATLSVYEPGNPVNALVVVEISHPVLEGNDLVYNYRLIEGKMPKSGGETALFIDWVGVGGGVGPGFHGVGVGARGVGVR
jgi:hypothetical protein